MRKLLWKIDHFFLSDDPENIVLSDRVVFYGFYLSVLLIFVVLISNLFFK